MTCMHRRNSIIPLFPFDLFQTYCSNVAMKAMSKYVPQVSAFSPCGWSGALGGCGANGWPRASSDVGTRKLWKESSGPNTSVSAFIVFPNVLARASLLKAGYILLHAGHPD